MIFTTNANTLQYATTTGSSWSNYAYQGAYGSGKPRIGAILFNGLRSSVNWSDMQVTGVDLWIDFGAAGASRRKTLGLWTTSRNSIGGTGSAMLGQSIGQVLTSSTTYGRDETITFNTSTNAAAFANLRTWIENSASNGLAIYLNETAGSSAYSANYTNITAARLTISYEVKGSKGTISPVSADIGQEVTLNIEPITSEYVVSHTVQWVCGDSASQIETLAGGVTETTYTIPSGWLNELEGVTEKAAKCVLTTYENGAEKATREIPFTVTVPDNYIPHINGFSVTRYTTAIDDYGQTVYIPDVSGGHVWVNAALQIDRDGGLNPGTAYIVYYPADDPQNTTTVNLSWPNDTLTLTDDRTIITTQIPTGSAYIFELHAANGHTEIVRQARVEKSWVPLHVAGTGYGLGFGMYSDGDEQNPKVQSAWPFYALGGSYGIFDVVYDSGQQIHSQSNGVETPQLTYTIPENGVYMVIGRGSFPTGTGGSYRFMAIKYGTTGTETELTAQTNPPQSSAGPRTSCIGIAPMTAGSVVALRFNQNSGSSIDVTMRLWVIKLGGQYAQ